VRAVVDEMRGGNNEQASEQLRKKGIDFLVGEAHFIAPHQVLVNGEVITAERIILATGCQAAVPEIAGLREAGFLTNVEAIWLHELPNRLAILGGGAIGIEFAQMFQRFGVKVTLIERNAQVLEKEERELADELSHILTREGVELITGADLQRVQKTPEGKRLTCLCGQGSEREFVVDDILIAPGRRPAVERLDLEQCGVRVSKHGIEVDETLRTSVPHIWGAGDVVARYKFTHVASEQGSLAARNAFAEQPTPFDARVVPWVTFTDPPLARVGQTEEQLRAKNIAYEVARVDFKSIERALILNQTAGRIKLLVDEQGQLLGGHILGAHADELLAPLTLAMHSHIPVGQLASTIFPYPTLGEGLRTAARHIA
jgi:pyruvate/2-oxoglutarate dehydrogenase complex dihydrolipoamide dehydrogenase (E3) component